MSQEDEPLTPMKLRERSGTTQRQIAAVLDVTIGTVSNWERRLKVPNLTLSQVLQLIELYQCSVGELHEAFGPIQVNVTVRELQGILEWCELPLSGLIDMLQTYGWTVNSKER